MATTVKGIFKNGHIEPLERIIAEEGTEVTITVPESKQLLGVDKRAYFGILKHLGEFTEDDFKAAEFNEERLLKEFED